MSIKQSVITHRRFWSYYIIAEAFLRDTVGDRIHIPSRGEGFRFPLAGAAFVVMSPRTARSTSQFSTEVQAERTRDVIGQGDQYV